MCGNGLAPGRDGLLAAVPVSGAADCPGRSYMAACLRHDGSQV